MLKGEFYEGSKLPGQDSRIVLGKVQSALGGKVDKQKGKGLSTHDYTAEDKEKVKSISTITKDEIDELF